MKMERLGFWMLASLSLLLAGWLMMPEETIANNGDYCRRDADCPARLYGEYCSPAGCRCRFGSLEVGLPLLEGFSQGASVCEYAKSFSTNPFGAILRMIVVAITALVVIAATVSVVIGGYLYMTAGGNADRVRQAKVWIGAAILGVVLALGSYVILYLINPSTVG